MEGKRIQITLTKENYEKTHYNTGYIFELLKYKNIAEMNLKQLSNYLVFPVWVSVWKLPAGAFGESAGPS